MQHLIPSMGKTKTNSHLPCKRNDSTVVTTSSFKMLTPYVLPFRSISSLISSAPWPAAAFIISPKPERLEILDLHYRNNQACSHSVHYRNNQACSAVRIQKRNHTSNLCSAAMRVSIFNCASLKTSKPCCLLRQVFVGSVVMLVSHLLFWLPSFIWVGQVKSKF